MKAFCERAQGVKGAQQFQLVDVLSNIHFQQVVTPPQTAPQPDIEASEQITKAGDCSRRDLPFEGGAYPIHQDKSSLASGDNATSIRKSPAPSKSKALYSLCK
jgi:hypothetical protein